MVRPSSASSASSGWIRSVTDQTFSSSGVISYAEELFVAAPALIIL